MRDITMTRYTIPEYCDPQRERGYIEFCSRHDRRVRCFIILLVAFGAGVAVCTLLTL